MHVKSINIITITNNSFFSILSDGMYTSNEKRGGKIMKEEIAN
jgi:hypothetical protein